MRNNPTSAAEVGVLLGIAVAITLVVVGVMCLLIH